MFSHLPAEGAVGLWGHRGRGDQGDLPEWQGRRSFLWPTDSFSSLWMNGDLVALGKSHMFPTVLVSSIR